MPTRSRSSSLYQPSTPPILRRCDSRRRVLQGAAGAGAISALGGLSTCGGGSGDASGEVTLGSRSGDPTPRAVKDAVSVTPPTPRTR